MFHVSHVLTDEANSSKITSSFFKENTSVNYQTKNCNASHKDFLQDLTSCKSLSDKNRCRHDTKSSKQRRQSQATRGYIFQPLFQENILHFSEEIASVSHHLNSFSSFSSVANYFLAKSILLKNSSTDLQCQYKNALDLILYAQCCLSKDIVRFGR